MESRSPMHNKLARGKGHQVTLSLPSLETSPNQEQDLQRKFIHTPRSHCAASPFVMEKSQSIYMRLISDYKSEE